MTQHGRSMTKQASRLPKTPKSKHEDRSGNTWPHEQIDEAAPEELARREGKRLPRGLHPGPR